MAVLVQVRERLRQAERKAQLASGQRAGAHSRRLIRRRRNEVLREHWLRFAVLVAIGAVSMVAARLLLPDGAGPYVVGAIAVGTIWVVVNALQWMDGMAGRRLGIAGEEWTSDELRRLQRRGWFFVNHVMLERGDVDHALFGPGGFFAIDSKYRTDWESAHGSLGEIAIAARRQATQLQNRLLTRTPTVRPMVVLWGPRSSKVFDDQFEHDGVLFCLGRSLRQFLLALPQSVDEADIDRAFTTLDRYVATRDIGESREHGDRARPIADHLQDVVLALFFASVTFVALSFATRVPPVGVWGLALSLVVLAVSLVVRRRTRASERAQRVTTATIAMALGWATLLLAVVVINLIW